MSAHDFLNSFSNGFMFGMLTSTPYSGLCNPFYSPYMTMPSIYMSPMSYSSYTPYFWDMPMTYSPYNPMQYNFNNLTNNEYNTMSSNLGFWQNNTLNYDFSGQNYTFNTNLNTNNSTNSNSQTSPGTYAGANDNVTELYKGSVDALNRKLAKGVMRGKGQLFMDMQAKYGINAAFLAAICIHESDCGRSAQATDSRNLHNVAGIMNPGGKDPRKFESVDACIEFLAKLIKNNYVGKGLTTINQIHMKYCPPSGDTKDLKGMNSGWGAGVARVKNELDNATA